MDIQVIQHLNQLIDCDEVVDHLAHSVTDIIPWFGASGSMFFNMKSLDRNFLVKLTFYKKTNAELWQSTTKFNPLDAEMQILRILNKKVVNTLMSPHVVELILQKKCDDITKLAPSTTACIDDLSKPVVDLGSVLRRKFCDILIEVAEGRYYPKCSFMVLQKCDMTLGQYMINCLPHPIAFEIFRGFMFQIIYTLYCIQLLYPEFKHNDLHADNILIYLDEKFRISESTRYIEYIGVKGRNYYLPYYGMQVKLADFGFSEIPEKKIFNSVMDDRAMPRTKFYSDILYLLGEINNILFSESFARGKRELFKDVLIELDPQNRHINYMYNSTVQPILPSDIVTAKFFDRFHIDPPPPRKDIYATYKCQIIPKI